MLPGPRAGREQHVGQGHGKGAGQSSNRRKGERTGKAVWGLFTQRQAVMRRQQAIWHGCVLTEHCGSGWRAGRFVSSSSPPSEMQLVEGETSPPSLPLAQTFPPPPRSGGPRNLTKHRAMEPRVKFHKCSPGIGPWRMAFSFCEIPSLLLGLSTCSVL